MYHTLRLLFLLASLDFSLSDCDSNHGPSGVTECFLEDQYYSEYQWGICLTAKYIETFSKGKYHCRNSGATYCYYQCMLEKHDIASGPVYSNCSCRQGEIPKTNKTVLPSSCFSPDGTECDWYENCLEKRYPCNNTDASYAVDYAKKFCDLYNEHYGEFSPNGQKWIDDVRKCLQVQLVPILWPYKTETCQNIMDRAFNSHAHCYVNPTGNRSSSFCSLCDRDKLSVFWTIKSAVLEEFMRSIRGLFDILSQCFLLKVKPLITGIKKIVIDVIVLSSFVRRRLRSLDTPHRGNWIEEHAYDIVDAISKKRRWSEKGIIWYASAVNKTVNNDSRAEIEIIIGEQKAYDLNYEGNVTANLTEEIDRVTEEIQQGKMVMRVEGYTIQVVKSTGCHDIACNSTYNEVESLPLDKTEEATTACKFPICWERKTIIVTAAGASGFILLLLISVCICRRRNRKTDAVI